jgi:prepilin-type N-terminal cleavage/methylation domain-containing protein
MKNNLANRLNENKSSKNGFTLMELLVVLMITGIVATVGLRACNTSRIRNKKEYVVRVTSDYDGRIKGEVQPYNELKTFLGDNYRPQGNPNSLSLAEKIKTGKTYVLTVDGEESEGSDNLGRVRSVRDTFVPGFSDDTSFFNRYPGLEYRRR